MKVFGVDVCVDVDVYGGRWLFICVHMVCSLVDVGVVPNMGVAFRIYIGYVSDRILFIELSFTEVLWIVCDVGGWIFWVHLLFKQVEVWVPDFAVQGFYVLEVWCLVGGKYWCEVFYRLAYCYGMVIIGGSDYYGGGGRCLGLFVVLLKVLGLTVQVFSFDNDWFVYV